MIDESTEPGAQVACHLRRRQRLAVNGNHAHTLMHGARAMLQPGETRTLRFTLGPGELRHWNTATRDR
jgi:hypothetical protein